MAYSKIIIIKIHKIDDEKNYRANYHLRYIEILWNHDIEIKIENEALFTFELIGFLYARLLLAGLLYARALDYFQEEKKI